MSAAPVSPIYGAVETSRLQSDLTDAEQLTLELAQNERVVQKTRPARGVLVGIVLGTAAWAGIILASAALIK